MPLLMKAQIPDYNKILSPQELCSDFDSLKTVMESVHPDIFYAFPKTVAEAKFDSIRSHLNKPMTVFQFNQSVKPYVTLFKDGHTSLSYSWRFWQQSDLKLFPYKVKIDKQNFEVTIKRNSAAHAPVIPVSSQITHINGMSIEHIILNMRKYICAESDNYLMSSMENEFSQLLWEAFNFANDFFITYITPESVSQDITVTGATTHEISKQEEETTASQDYSWRILTDNNSCLLEFNSFNNPAKFDSLLVNMFTEIKEKNIEDLIIDLRNNGGGNSILGDEFLQYIAKEPFSMFGPTTVKISPYLKSFIRKFRNADYYKTLSDDNIDSLLNKPDGLEYASVELTSLRNNPLRYTGNVYALISGITFSSASDFAWVLKHYGIATLIGEETGGLITCYGDVLSYKLPHSGLTLGVSYKKFYGIGASDEDNHGVMPDFVIDSDKAFDYTINLIKNKSASKKKYKDEHN
jgi:hypothetical protein